MFSLHDAIAIEDATPVDPQTVPVTTTILVPFVQLLLSLLRNVCGCRQKVYPIGAVYSSVYSKQLEDVFVSTGQAGQRARLPVLCRRWALCVWCGGGLGHLCLPHLHLCTLVLTFVPWF